VDKPWQEQPIEGLTFKRMVRSGDVVLAAHDLAKRYGGRTLFGNLDFVVRRGDRLVIQGANGSGKTTLLNIILGREQPDSGSISFRRQDSIRDRGSGTAGPGPGPIAP